MRRCLAVVGLLAIGSSGCSDFRSLFSAHAGVVADVGGQQLTAERLSQILTSGPGAQVTRDAAEYITQLWVDYALFARAAAAGKLPMDSAGIAEALWSEVAEMRGRRWHDTIVARRRPADSSQADSAYKANEVRVLQHILFRSAAASPPADRAAARKKAEAALGQVRGGADFGALAARLSEDPGSKVDSGFLPPSPRGQFVPTFDSAGWALAPGATSGVIETPFGYHIIKRPAAAAVRGRLMTLVSAGASARLDSLYMDSLATANKIEISAGAPAAIRAALNDPHGSRRSTKAVATFKDGKLTVGEFVRWLQALPPQYTMQLKQVPDSMLQRFARILTQNVLLVRAADKAGIRLTADEWSTLKAQHTAQIDTLRRELGLTSPEFQDSTLSADRRTKLAALKVDQYFDELAAGRRRLVPIPPAFTGLLRDRGSYRVYAAGVNRAIELARTAKAAESAAAGGGAAPGPLKRAPGPPPIPGAQPPAPRPAPAPDGGAH
jgi:hypothetical protein